MDTVLDEINKDLLMGLWDNPPERYPNLTDKTIIYLDQKEWGNLLEGYLSADSDYRAAYRFAKKSTDELGVVYPFSIENLIETGKSRSWDFREEMFEVVWEISKNHSIGNFMHVVDMEAEAYIRQNDPELEDIKPESKVFGKGLSFPHGEFSVSPDDWLTDEELEKLKCCLSSDELNERYFRSEGLIGYETPSNPEQETEYVENIEEIRRSEGDDGLDPDDDEHREGYVIGAFRNLMLPRLEYYGQEFDLDTTAIIQIDGSGVHFEDYFSRFPAFFTYANLAFARDSHVNRDIEINDLMDVFSLGTATPYADVVITEEFFGGMLYKYGLNEIFDTQVLFDIRELEDMLS